MWLFFLNCLGRCVNASWAKGFDTVPFSAGEIVHRIPLPTPARMLECLVSASYSYLRLLQECCPSTSIDPSHLKYCGLEQFPPPSLSGVFICTGKTFKISLMLVLGQVSLKGKVQDQVWPCKGTWKLKRQHASKWMGRQQREEPLTVITQFLGSEKIPLITRENRKINTQKIGKKVEHIT